MLKNKLTNHHGFTLTELLVALVLNAFLLIGLVSIFTSNLNHYRTSISVDRLNGQLEAAMLLMTDDIRRAGYWSNATNDIGTDQNNNPFMTSSTNISVNNSGNCILFTYDKNQNGSLPSISSSYDDERYGFRLRSQAIQARPPGASFSCTASTNAWENITDSNIIEITALNFTLTKTTLTVGPDTQGIVSRSVDITLTGRLSSDHSITRTLTQHVRIRNDKFTP